jgi:hypothetical protein
MPGRGEFAGRLVAAGRVAGGGGAVPDAPDSRSITAV